MLHPTPEFLNISLKTDCSKTAGIWCYIAMVLDICICSWLPAKETQELSLLLLEQCKKTGRSQNTVLNGCGMDQVFDSNAIHL